MRKLVSKTPTHGKTRAEVAEKLIAAVKGPGMSGRRRRMSSLRLVSRMTTTIRGRRDNHVAADEFAPRRSALQVNSSCQLSVRSGAGGFADIRELEDRA